MYRLTIHLISSSGVKCEINNFDTIYDAKRFLMRCIETANAFFISFGLFNRKSHREITNKIQIPETYLQELSYTQN